MLQILAKLNVKLDRSEVDKNKKIKGKIDEHSSILI